MCYLKNGGRKTYNLKGYIESGTLRGGFTFFVVVCRHVKYLHVEVEQTVLSLSVRSSAN